MNTKGQMRVWVGAGIAVLLTAGSAAAEHPGQGRGRSKSATPAAKESGKRVVNEAADAVADELLGQETTSGRPPGLSKKDHLPPGLAKQGRVPPGWSKGRKEGWDKTPKESPLRRMIRGIFRRPPNPAPPAQ